MASVVAVLQIWNASSVGIKVTRAVIVLINTVDRLEALQEEAEAEEVDGDDEGNWRGLYHRYIGSSL